MAEASFAGLPVVGYKIDWHSEIIEDGVTGYLVKTGDCTLFSQLILKVLNNKDLAEKFSKNIREKAEILLSPDKIIEIEIECFKKLKEFISIFYEYRCELLSLIRQNRWCKTRLINFYSLTVKKKKNSKFIFFVLLTLI